MLEDLRFRDGWSLDLQSRLENGEGGPELDACPDNEMALNEANLNPLATKEEEQDMVRGSSSSTGGRQCCL